MSIQGYGPCRMELNKKIKTEYLVIGSGIAGLMTAIELATRGKKVLALTKAGILDANTFKAQGGIATADSQMIALGQDSVEDHIRDTLKAGAGLCNPQVVNLYLRLGHSIIGRLESLGIEFSRAGNRYDLHQEGGHSTKRIYNVEDYTGKAIQETLSDRVLNDSSINGNITVLEHSDAINLITYNRFAKDAGLSSLPQDYCLGAYFLDRQTGRIHTVQADFTFLATGGAGRAFLYTTNLETATGDGIAMAFRAGADIENIEFTQFHPTEFYGEKPRFLITEATRGHEVGAKISRNRVYDGDLVLEYEKKRKVKNPEGSAGTRDVVSQAIDYFMKTEMLDHVWLHCTIEVTGKSAEYLREKFPQLDKNCRANGIDFTKQPIPVVPAAHYTCGGVKVNEVGLTKIQRLYAIGEVACTGLMGANRLASNSLLEGAVMAELSTWHAIQQPTGPSYEVPLWVHSKAKSTQSEDYVHSIWDATRRTMTAQCGIVRNRKGLELAIYQIMEQHAGAEEIYQRVKLNHDIIEIRNITGYALMHVLQAWQRRESRGGHFRSDYPNQDPAYARPSIINRDTLAEGLKQFR